MGIIGYQQSLTQTSTTVKCNTFKDKIDSMAGPDAELSGGYAQVSGYTYSTPACTSGACDSQDLSKLAAALEETPVSVCVNAGAFTQALGMITPVVSCPQRNVAAWLQMSKIIASWLLDSTPLLPPHIGLFAIRGQAVGVRRATSIWSMTRTPVGWPMMQLFQL